MSIQFYQRNKYISGIYIQNQLMFLFLDSDHIFLLLYIQVTSGSKYVLIAILTNIICHCSKHSLLSDESYILQKRAENIIIVKRLLIYIRNCGLLLYQQKNDYQNRNFCYVFPNTFLIVIYYSNIINVDCKKSFVQLYTMT